VAAVNVTEVGTFLTKASFDPVIRAQTAWSSFFRVRKDDLESARVERRIKRTKSDVTTHLSPSRDAGAGDGIIDTTLARNGLHAVSRSNLDPSESGGYAELDTSGAQHLSFFRLPAIPSSKLDFNVDGERREPSSATDMTDLTESSDMGDTGILELPSRPRTAMSESDPGPRGSRTIEMPGPQTAPPSPRSRTVSKRSKAMTIDSFEIMRVLGKGCAGKVLLVRQRETDALYALKAIHKQHVRPCFALVVCFAGCSHSSFPLRSSLIANSPTRKPSRRC
jgi:serum/glucocorticoid-regulated kinase 2